LLILIVFSGFLSIIMPVAAQTQPQATQNIRVYLPLIAHPPIATSLEQRVIDLTNEYRQQNGCAALMLSPELTISARQHSQDMADNDYFSHNDLSGHSPGWRAAQAGYDGVAGWENIAAGFATAESVVSAWYNELPPNDGHRRNMLDCSLTDIGVGYGDNPNSPYGTYWTQDFGVN
jgi:uncharacterized protein YkwD